MKKRHEFRWVISPKPHRPIEGKKNEDGFEIEWKGDRLTIQSEYTDAPEDEVKQRAKTIATSQCHAMGYLLGQRLVPTLARTEHTPARGGSSDIGLPLGDNAAHMRDKVEVELCHGVDVVIAVSSDDVDFDKVLALAEKSRRDSTLKQMLDYIGKFRDDPEKKLGPLYNIIELAETKLGGEKGAPKSLDIKDNAWKKAKRTMNRKTILTSRHPGKGKQPKRSITDKELAHCIKVAEAIINSYASRLLS